MRGTRLTNAPVTLHVSHVDKEQAAEGPLVTALHGTHKGRAWRLSMADAVLACKSGRYIFCVEHEGERRKLSIATGAPRLEGPSRTQGDLLLQLPSAPETVSS